MALESNQREELAIGLYDTGLLRFGKDLLALSSGRLSPIYYNQRMLSSFNRSFDIDHQRRIRQLAITAYAGAIEALPGEHAHLYGIPEGATSIGAMVALVRGESYLWGRAVQKQHGEPRFVEGHIAPGEAVKVIDDVVTTAASKLTAAEHLAGQGLRTLGFTVMLDRQEGGKEAMEEAGHAIISVFGLSEVVERLLEAKRIGYEELDWLQQYHEGIRNDGGISTFNLDQ